MHHERIPDFLPQFVAVSAWNFSPEEFGREFQLTLVVHPPSGPVQTFEMVLEPSENFQRRAFMQFQFFEITHVGKWRFEIRIDNQHGADHIVEITHSPAAQGTHGA